MLEIVTPHSPAATDLIWSVSPPLGLRAKLATRPRAQAYFANGNNEWPVVKGSVLANPTLAALGTFRPDALPIGDLAKNSVLAQKVFDRAGWK